MLVTVDIKSTTSETLRKGIDSILNTNCSSTISDTLRIGRRGQNTASVSSSTASETLRIGNRSGIQVDCKSIISETLRIGKDVILPSSGSTFGVATLRHSDDWVGSIDLESVVSLVLRCGKRSLRNIDIQSSGQFTLSKTSIPPSTGNTRPQRTLFNPDYYI